MAAVDSLTEKNGLMVPPSNLELGVEVTANYSAAFKVGLLFLLIDLL